MRYLTTALISEGTTDDRLLPPLLGRMLQEICADYQDSVEVADVRPVREKKGPRSLEEVLDLVDRNRGSFLVVFFHHDRGARPGRTETEWLEPLRAAWGSRSEQLVTVVPVRETEAWLLADGDALRRAFGVQWPDSQLGVPAQPKDVEGLIDPKQVLDRSIGRLSRSTADHYSQLGAMVSLERLCQVPAFAQLWRETQQALEKLGFR
ncbi:hypothetical protein GCM10010435_13330 [Winogradskya consettensis]|uniref:DUF4276 family protein n=1 Tax=Winogradskya consettensis TaxID=113560 RepID=A0A919SBN9_9ACTN|nr:DUF4276 family protein [Actinoplanes consettensis]GIM68861.1 hypothetical protein Aco04nite_12600 [Actinoplanes consettensis]